MENKFSRFLKNNLSKQYFDIVANSIYEIPIIEFCGIIHKKPFEYCYIIGTNNESGISGQCDEFELKTKYHGKIYKKMKHYSVLSCNSNDIRDIIRNIISHNYDKYNTR